MLRSFRNTQTQSFQLGFGSSPRAARAAGPTRPGPARPAGAELPRPAQGEGPAGQRRALPFPSLLADMERPHCCVWIPGEHTRGFGRARPGPARATEPPAGRGREKEQAEEGRRSSLTGRSGAQRGLTTQGAGSSLLSPGAAPSCSCCCCRCSPPQRCHGPRARPSHGGKMAGGAREARARPGLARGGSRSGPAARAAPLLPGAFCTLRQPWATAFTAFPRRNGTNTNSHLGTPQ